MSRTPYRGRSDAGRAILAKLAPYRGDPGVLVVGLARGGVPVAAVVAAGLGAELDVSVVRKLGVPGHEELALGAISRGRTVFNEDLRRSLAVPQSDIDAVIDRESRELVRRELTYREGRAPTPMTGRTVILVDDGIATGASMRVAALDARAEGAARVIVAVPIAPAGASSEFADVADEFVCPHTPREFVAVGMYYRDFHQTTDEEVCALLRRSG